MFLWLFCSFFKITDITYSHACIRFFVKPLPPEFLHTSVDYYKPLKRKRNLSKFPSVEGGFESSRRTLAQTPQRPLLRERAVTPPVRWSEETMHGFTQRLILQQHICIQKTASWHPFQDALFFYFKIYHEPREATLGCRFRAGFKPAAGGSDLVNVSVGSSSDSQQDLKILLRVPGGDIQSDSVLEVHVEGESQWNSCSVMSRTSHSNLTSLLHLLSLKKLLLRKILVLSLVFTSHTHTV